MLMTRPILFLGAALSCAVLRADAQQHHHPDGKPPSAATAALQAAQRALLPFADTRDQAEQQRGFLAAPAQGQIRDANGELVWDMDSFAFLDGAEEPDSVHPSLLRQARLNRNFGLYEVLPGAIYQVRGFDLANISFVRGETGWIVLDPLTVRETAAAALDLVNATLGTRPVVAVIYSHPHADHFGGVHGVVDEQDVASGKVPVIAPDGFMEHAIAENVYAGAAMNRRLAYQYGTSLPRHITGFIDQAIGKGLPSGTLGLIAPTRLIAESIETLTIDGVEMVFHSTPGTEAPVEMNTWFPQHRALWAAENVSGTIHNIYTLRGALVRDALQWSREINRALYLFGGEAELMFTAHNWPRWGNDRVQSVLRAQRDAYAHLNNQVLHLANGGVTINEIHNLYQLPASLQQQWAARSYHGSEAHNSRAVINRYLGYWDANPTTLMPLSPAESAPLHVEMMGGAAPILARARLLIDEGRYRHATELLDKLLYAEPDNQECRGLLADAFEQLGYQSESASLRNSFLAAAQELRSGIAAPGRTRSQGPEVLRSLTTSMWLDYLGISIDSRAAEGLAFIINFISPDTGEQHVLELSNATLTNIGGFLHPTPDLTVTVNRHDLARVISQEETFAALIGDGRARLEGSASALLTLQGLVRRFDGNFELLPGTRR